MMMMMMMMMTMMMMMVMMIMMVMMMLYIFVGTWLLSVGSKLPGAFHRLLDPAMLKARPLARTKGHTDSGPSDDDDYDDDDDDE